MSLKHTFVAGQLALLCTLHAASAGAGGSMESGPSVLFATDWGKANGENEAYLKRLRDSGFAVSSTKIGQVNPGLLSQFDVVVLPALPPADHNTRTSTTASNTVSAQAQLHDMLDAYLASGGGLVIAGPLWGWTIGWSDLGASNAYLRKWGAQIIPELVLDRQHYYQQPTLARQAYSFTTNIPRSPVSNRVSTIWYPVDVPNNGGAAPPSTAALKLGRDWTVAVRGEETAGSYPIANRATSAIAEKPSTFKRAPPFVAIRSAGKGRIALVAIAPVHTIWGYAHPFWQNVTMVEGDGHRKSDLAQLFDNLYRWLGAPRHGKSVGGYSFTKATGEARGRDPLDSASPKTIDWTRAIWDPIAPGSLTAAIPTSNQPFELPGRGLKHYRGLIGARTALTGARGSLDEYVAAGKTSGLHFIVFVEDLERMTKETWDRFKKDCALLSSEDFLAIPGFEWRSLAGDRSIIAGPLEYPDPSVFASGTRRIAHPAAFWFAAGAPMNLPASRSNPTPLWNAKAVNAFPVEVWTDGKRTEDNLEQYLYDQARDHFYTPVIVNWVTSPQELEAVARLAPATVLLGASLDDVLSNVRRNIFEQQRMLAYVSDGPQIAVFEGFNLTRATSGGLSVQGTDQWRIRLAVASAKGLREVRVYDGRELSYRFDGRGNNELVTEIDGHHDRQHHWILQVEDSAGRRAVGPAFGTRDHLATQQMDADRQNHDPAGIQRDQRGRLQIMYQYATHQFFKGRMQVFRPGCTSNQSEFHAPGLDATEYSWFWSPALDLRSKPAEGPVDGWAMRYFTTCSAVEVFIVDMWLDQKFPGRQGTQVGLQVYDKAVPAEVASLSVRYIDTFHPYGRPAAVVCELCLRFLRDVAFPADAPSPKLIAAGHWGPWPGHYDSYALAAGGQTIGGSLLAEGSSINRSELLLKPGDYVALYPSLWGSGIVMALSENLTLDFLAVKQGLHSVWGVQLPKREFRAGEELRGTLLFVRGAYPEPANNALAETIRADMGFVGPPSYSIESRIGRIISTRYRVRAEAQNGVWAGALGSAELPVYLPVEVSGLNTRWEAFLHDRKTQAMRPVPVVDGIGYASIDTRAGADLAIGHPAMSSAPELRLSAFPVSNKWSITIHNPSASSVTTTLKGNAEFPGMAGLSKQVSVPARSSISVPVP